MKYLFSFFISLLLLFPTFVLSKSYNATYKIKTNGLLIGKLDWGLEKNASSYSLNIELKSKGMLSTLFSFSGSYLAKGDIIEERFVSAHYSQAWKTNKKKRDVEISFVDENVVSIKQRPKENESLRADLDSFIGYSDPLTSFLKLLSGSNKSKTIDGRRAYTLQLVEEGKQNKKYVVKNFSNLWADHKRNGLKYVYFESGESQFIPKSIVVNFKGRLFKVLID